MPELPEVETVCRQLEKAVVGKKINEVEIRFSGRLNLSVEKFSAEVCGRRIAAIDRRAKLIMIRLSGGKTLVVHLKMTGKLLLVEPDHEPGKHTHIIFRLSGRRVLFFDDMRKFGFVRLFDTADVESKVIAPAKLGAEPFGPDFTVKGFSACLARHGRSAIKALLLSQKCVVGVGNIYSDETLWRAQIRPDRLAGDLRPAEVKRLHVAIKSILKKAIEMGGSSVGDYRNAENQRGSYARLLKAYGRAGQPCQRCRKPIKKTRLAGRGTHYCPTCQK
jgi:formamidopyrimidine-DNA glycosylase